MPGRDQRLPLPATLSPAQRDFYDELRRLIDVAGLTCRALEAVTSVQPGSGEPAFYSKSRWGRWVNGQSHPPRKAIRILAGKLADDEIKSGHLLELRDVAFAPVSEPDQVQPDQATREEPSPAGTGPDSPVAGQLAALVAAECAAELNDRVLQGWKPLAVGWRQAAGLVDPEAARDLPAGDTGGVRGGRDRRAGGARRRAAGDRRARQPGPGAARGGCSARSAAPSARAIR